jgi:hypothetical protein
MMRMSRMRMRKRRESDVGVRRLVVMWVCIVRVRSVRVCSVRVCVVRVRRACASFACVVRVLLSLFCVRRSRVMFDVRV